LHWLAQVSYRVLCLYAVCCFPLFNCSGASQRSQARHRLCERRKGEHIMARLPCQEVPQISSVVPSPGGRGVL